VSLHIERLVLEGLGVERAEGERLREALVEALLVRLGDPDAWTPLRESSRRRVGRLDAAPLVLGRAERPDASTAAAIADRVSASLSTMSTVPGTGGSRS
jgi:hypothetical protein